MTDTGALMMVGYLGFLLSPLVFAAAAEVAEFIGGLMYLTLRRWTR